MVWDIFGQDWSVSWKWSVNLSDFRLYIDAKILPLWEKNHVTRYNYTCHKIYISGWKKPHAEKLHCGKNLESNKTNLIVMEKTCEKVIIITKCVEKSDVIYIPNCLCKKSIEIPKIYLPLIIKTDIHTQPLTILRVIKYKTSLRYIHNNVEKIIHNKKKQTLCIYQSLYSRKFI